MNISLSVDQRSTVPLSQQLYEQLRDLILKGQLHPGSRVPTTRELSRQLKISRPTVTLSINRLAREGYIELRQGSGAYVHPEINVRAADRNAPVQQRSHRLPLSDFTSVLAKELSKPRTEKNDPEIAFYFWQPAVEYFPSAEIARIAQKHHRASYELAEHRSMYDGCLQLREAITGLVARMRGVVCTADQVIIVSGINQALHLISRIHVERDGAVAVEDPCFDHPRLIFKANGAQIIPIPVDEGGMEVEWLRKSAYNRARILHVTPSRQFPTGAKMPVGRRLELLDWAERSGAVVVEDDYDSDYESVGRPMPALMSLDRSGSVVYVGTLQRLLFSSVGVDFLIVPPGLAPLYRKARTLIDDPVPFRHQTAIAEFISEGHLERHVKRLSGVYAEKREILSKALRETLGERVEIGGDTAGVFVRARLLSDLPTEEIKARAAKVGVGLISSDKFYLGPAPRNEFILGFGNLSEEQINEGIKRIALCLQ